MEQRISFITLGTADFGKMKAWYREVFGWTPVLDRDDICFFQLNGCILGLYPAKELAEDIGVREDGHGFRRFALSVNYRSEEEVDDVTARLREQGARIVTMPERVFWGGYRGYIADPEDNYRELAYNPQMAIDAEGNVRIHEEL